MFKNSKSLKMRNLLEKYIPDYRLNLLDISDIKDVKIFKSDLQMIFGMLKYRQNKDELRKYIHNHRTYFENIDIETCQASEVLLGANDEFRKALETNMKAGGEVNMCKALDDIVRDGELRGLEQGIEQGKLLGRQQGIEQGILRGRQQGESSLAKLITYLISAGRTSDVQRVAEDADYRHKLMNELFNNNL
jgi:hypothetical protein